MTQLISFIDTDPVNHLSARFGHRMEEVVDNSRFGAVLTNLQVKSGVHVHHHRFDSSAPLRPRLLEERAFIQRRLAGLHREQHIIQARKSPHPTHCG